MNPPSEEVHQGNLPKCMQEGIEESESHVTHYCNLWRKKYNFQKFAIIFYSYASKLLNPELGVKKL